MHFFDDEEREIGGDSRRSFFSFPNLEIEWEEGIMAWVTIRFEPNTIYSLIYYK